MQYLSKGKRSIVYTTRERGKTVVLKTKRPGSAAMRTLENESFWLQKLNPHGIGPRFIRFENGNLVMEYIKGIPFVDWYKNHQGKERQQMIKKIFQQCRILDMLQVNKLEMHHPVKHILIRSGKPVFIDFERCKRTLKPKNATQFCQFLLYLGEKVDTSILKALLAHYKKTYDEKDFNLIVRLFMRT